jgi:thiol-disulfide isomerase/thioredoxin
MRDETPGTGAADVPPDTPPPTTPRLSGLARTLLLAGVVTLAFIVGAAVTTMLADDGTAPAPAAVNPGSTLEDRIPPTHQAPLPDVELAGFAEGEPVDLGDYRGRPLLVNFWASWCAPCVKEMPDVEAVARDLAGEVAVLGVNVQDAPANAEAFVDELGVSYDLATDPRGELYAEVEAFGMPTTLLVDADGMIVYRHTGIVDAEQLRELIAEHLDV